MTVGPPFVQRSLQEMLASGDRIKVMCRTPMEETPHSPMKGELFKKTINNPLFLYLPQDMLGTEVAMDIYEPTEPVARLSEGKCEVLLELVAPKFEITRIIIENEEYRYDCRKFSLDNINSYLCYVQSKSGRFLTIDYTVAPLSKKFKLHHVQVTNSNQQPPSLKKTQLEKCYAI